MIKTYNLYEGRMNLDKISNNESSKNKYTGKKPARQAYDSLIPEVSCWHPNYQKAAFLNLSLYLDYGNVRISQKTIGEFTGTSHDSGHNQAQFLRRTRFLQIKRNPVNVYDICTYILNPKYTNPHALFELMPYFASIGLTQSKVRQFFHNRKLFRKNKSIQTAKSVQNIPLTYINYLLDFTITSSSKTTSLVSLSHNKSEKSESDNQYKVEQVTTKKDRVGASMFTATEKSMLLDKLRRKENVDWCPVPVKQLKVMTLTDLGKANLCAFPEEAINYAIFNFNPKSTTKNPYALFLGIAKQYCTKNNLPIDWRFCFNLIDALGLDKSSATYTEVKFEIQSSSSKKESKNSQTISDEEAARRNYQTRLSVCGSVEDEREFSKQYDSARPSTMHQSQDKPKYTQSTEPMDDMVKNLSLLRQMSQEGTTFQKEVALIAIKSVEKEIARRIDAQGVSPRHAAQMQHPTVRQSSNPSSPLCNPEKQSQTVRVMPSTKPVREVPTPTPPAAAPDSCVDFTDEDVYEEVYD